METSPSRAARTTRSWVVAITAIAAWGAGLIQAALGAGAVADADSSIASRAAGFVVLTFGAAALVWGGFALARARLPVPRAAVAGAVAGILMITVALLVDAAHTSVFAAAVAWVLLIVVAAASARTMRLLPHADAGAREEPGGRSGGGMALTVLGGAIVVAALVTPALSSVEATRLSDTPGGYQPATHDH